jgi:cytochrome P450
MAHVMKNSVIYEKPWQSRRLITGLIGCGLLAAEGQVHKRQRRVATPAFSISNLRKLVPLVWRKGGEIRDRWILMLDQFEKQESGQSGMVVDVSEWISRATFDVIGLAGFDYDFDATNNEGGNELFRAYKEMFEVAISQNPGLRQIVGIYLPWIDQLFVCFSFIHPFLHEYRL